jgi:hypothetical protein
MLTSLTFIWEHTGRISNYNYDRPDRIQGSKSKRSNDARHEVLLYKR